MVAPGRILVVRNDRLGDAVLTLPVIPFLRNKFPDSDFIFWASPMVAPIIRCVEGVVGVVESADDVASSDVLEELKNLNIRTAYCFRPTRSNAMMLLKAGITRRIGTARRWYSFLFNDRVNLKRQGSNLHEAELNLMLAGEKDITKTHAFPKITLPQKFLDTARGLLSAKNIDTSKPYVIIHPGSGGSARDWHPDYFRQLSNSLYSEAGLQVIVTGGANEREITAQVAGDRHINIAGETDLLALAAVIRGAALLVSNSTGPLHLAVALGTKVVGLYPPVKDCLPERWGPYGHYDWAMVAEGGLCGKCVPGEFSGCACMEKIKPEAVLARCLKVMAEND